jgi:predicted nuclease with TOPRIM domain
MAKGNQKDYITKKVLDEAVETILKGMDNLFDKFKGEMYARFENVENRLDRIEAELSYVKDEIKGLKADFSTTPSRREFEELKVRVEKHYPLS